MDKCREVVDWEPLDIFGGRLPVRCNEPLPCLTHGPKYYIVPITTTLVDLASDEDSIMETYSIIKITEKGAYEVDRAYRSVKEALEAWPHAIAPAQE